MSPKEAKKVQESVKQLTLQYYVKDNKHECVPVLRTNKQLE